MPKVNIVRVRIAGKFSHIKIFPTSKDFNILSKMAAALEISLFLEKKKCYKMFEASKLFSALQYDKNVKRKLPGVCLPFFFFVISIQLKVHCSWNFCYCFQFCQM